MIFTTSKYREQRKQWRFLYICHCCFYQFYFQHTFITYQREIYAEKRTNSFSFAVIETEKVQREKILRRLANLSAKSEWQFCYQD